jgi:type IV secretory pathway VirJ component
MTNGHGSDKVVRVGTVVAIAFAATLLSTPPPRGAPTPEEVLRSTAFGNVTLYAPPRAPEQVVLFVSGDGGWNLGVVDMARRLTGLGALVAGIDIGSYRSRLAKANACAYPAGDLEELSRDVQLRHKLPVYRRPILVGYSSGATLAYLALAAAPPTTFAGGISLGFCPDLALGTPPCRGARLPWTEGKKHGSYVFEPAAGLVPPWMVLQGEKDQVCAPATTRRFVSAIRSARVLSLPKVGHGFAATNRWDGAFVEAYRAVSAPPPEPAPASMTDSSDLGVVEVQALAPERDLFALILTGDGGWADLDKGVADSLARQGVPSVGWSSLRYYWTPRTPDTAAADLDRILRHYLGAWRRSQALLVGYSFGADVLPFLASRLPAETRSRLGGVVLLGPSERASFAFHLSSWLGGGGDPAFPVRPELRRLAGLAVTCVREGGDRESPCAADPSVPVHVVTLPGGHHFGGDYERLGEIALETVSPPR